MSYIGDFAVDSTFDVKFCTVSTTGAPTTLAGTPVISAYLDNSLTQITAGITLTVDFDAVTGLHNIRVVATTANGYTAGSNFQLVITAGTVGGTSVVGYVVGEFSIQARSALRPTVAARTLDVTATGEAGIDLDNTVGTLAKTTDITGFNDLSAAQVNAEVDAALDTAIPAVNVADSVNDVLLDRVKPNLDVVVSTRATPAQVNTEVLDVLNTDTFAEPAQGTPAATNTLVNKISFLYKYLRNRITSTSTTISIFNDDAITVDHKSTHSDDGTVYDRGEFTTGP